MKFKVTSIGIKSIKDKLDKLNKVNNNDFQKRVLLRLANLGIASAKISFERAIYDGTNDVTIGEPEWVNSTTIQIVAKGNAVTFIEFGSGVYYSEAHPKAAELGAIRGKYGKGRGKQTVWGYYGEPGSNGIVRKHTEKGDLVTTHGNPPNKAMYEAGKEMRNRILEVIKEELNI